MFIPLCFRYISKEILTIREAVWLTDNTYQYEDLVRMMGEVISVLEGRIQVNVKNERLPFRETTGCVTHGSFFSSSPQTPTVLDYGEVLQSLLPMQRGSAHLFSYICELSLLFSPHKLPGPARLASATLLLTRALHNCGRFMVLYLLQILLQALYLHVINYARYLESFHPGY